jgi:hypothetical protein
MSQQQQVLKQELTVPQILRTCGKQFRQITERYSDGHNGRCAMGVVLSYFGWDGKLDSDITTSLQAALPTLSNAGLRDDFYIIELNDSGMTFDEIADYLDRVGYGSRSIVNSGSGIGDEKLLS